MNDTRLNAGSGEDRLNGLRKALQPVDYGDQDVLHTPIAQVAEDLGPEFGPFIRLEPQPQNVPCAVRQDRERHEDSLVRDSPITADIDPDRVHEDDRVAGFQRTVLPGGDLLHHGVGNRGNEARGGLNAIDFFNMPLDFAGCQTSGIHADDLAVELGKATLILCNQHRIKRTVPIPGNIQNNLAALCRHGLLAIAVSAVGRLIILSRGAIGALLIKMKCHLRVERPLRQSLRQFREYAAFAKQVAR
ncbi:hypothetical protein GLX_12280 [Komagataeibacter medellinensis NBRC 3288]|uniref:Uncharacterized protein n=1 Tax=Komagataeibacter medellinensis (strain NBRC 3288 / BCRC 11682 / LMG 1693 / Kondo 51) TaxID=634177 RepID=G2I693_KOMMN|nr:hypothetical protein GLX_12280 [Komagataeibacter medellinensis NBRC 3288]